MTKQTREYYVLIEQDEDGYFIGEVPQLSGCYSQGQTIDELMVNIREAIELCLEDEQTSSDYRLLLDVQKVVL